MQESKQEITKAVSFVENGRKSIKCTNPTLHKGPVLVPLDFVIYILVEL